MSWSIKVVGSRAAVRAYISNPSQSMPAQVRAYILDLAQGDVNPADQYAGRGLFVEGYGHSTDPGAAPCTWANCGKLVVEPIQLAVEVPVLNEQPAGDPAGPSEAVQLSDTPPETGPHEVAPCCGDSSTPSGGNTGEPTNLPAA